MITGIEKCELYGTDVRNFIGSNMNECHIRTIFLDECCVIASDLKQFHFQSEISIAFFRPSSSFLEVKQIIIPFIDLFLCSLISFVTYFINHFLIADLVVGVAPNSKLTRHLYNLTF